jgi:hypothetical protein
MMMYLSGVMSVEAGGWGLETGGDFVLRGAFLAGSLALAGALGMEYLWAKRTPRECGVLKILGVE